MMIEIIAAISGIAIATALIMQYQEIRKLRSRNKMLKTIIDRHSMEGTPPQNDNNDNLRG